MEHCLQRNTVDFYAKPYCSDTLSHCHLLKYQKTLM